MLEFDNIKELQSMIKTSKRKKIRELSVFGSFLRMALFLAFYAILIILTTLFLYLLLSKSAKMVKVPAVINRDFLEAYVMLKDLKLNVDVSLKNYEKIPFGTVVAQDIPPESLIKEKRKLTLTVSMGREQVVRMTNRIVELRSVFIAFTVPEDVFELVESQDGATNVSVTIYVTDEGEYDDEMVYFETHKPGERIRLPLKVDGEAVERILFDDILYMEKEIE